MNIFTSCTQVNSKNPVMNLSLDRNPDLDSHSMHTSHMCIHQNALIKSNSQGWKCLYVEKEVSLLFSQAEACVPSVGC